MKLPQLEPELTSSAAVRQALKTIGIPHEIGYIGVTNDILRETLLHAHELRARFTVVDFLIGQGVLEKAAAFTLTSSQKEYEPNEKSSHY